MNIFVVDDNPERAARMMCDKHIVKMILESKDLLRLSMYANCEIAVPSTDPMRRYKNHPCTKWAQTSYSNWEWLRKHAVELCNEYTFRYGKIHYYDFLIRSFLTAPHLWKEQDLTPYPQCMPQIYKTTDAVAAYRNYYLGAKQHILSYTKREIPDWVRAAGLGVQK